MNMCYIIAVLISVLSLIEARCRPTDIAVTANYSDRKAVIDWNQLLQSNFRRENPCASNVCIHASECLNLIDDYSCTCYPKFGGKNCSVELVGCKDVECSNGGHCNPKYYKETHHFTCNCQAGFIGKFCEKSTTFSLGGTGYILLDPIDINGYHLKMSIRTTYPNGVLAVGQTEDQFYMLGLENGRIALHTSFLNRHYVIFAGNELNDGEWKQVFLYINQTHVYFTAHNETIVYEFLEEASGISFMSTSIGGNSENSKEIFTESSKFIGCMQDISLGTQTVIPAEYSASKKVNVRKGCHHEEQCKSNPCENNGMCVDLRFTFQCMCKNPFWGKTCSKVSISFGDVYVRRHNIFKNISKQVQESFQNEMDVSVYFRIRNQNGMVFYIGSYLHNSTISDPEVTFILAELFNGVLWTRVKMSNFDKIIAVPASKVNILGDNQINLIEVIRVESHIDISINEAVIFDETINCTNVLNFEVMYLGGKQSTELGQVIFYENRRMQEHLMNRKSRFAWIMTIMSVAYIFTFAIVAKKKIVKYVQEYYIQR